MTEETHVVADDSDDPEHIDDCPGCDRDATLDKLDAEQKLIRDHTLTLHQIGEQLSEVESWFWAHLADVREAARQKIGGPLPDDVVPAMPSAPADRPTTGQDTLRERIAEALLDHLSRIADIRKSRTGELAFMLEITDAERMRIAEHLVAALPATVDRAAVLREAADHFDRMGRTVLAASQVRDELLRLAREAQQGGEDGCTCGSAGEEFRPTGHYRDCPGYARKAQQDPTRPGDATVDPAMCPRCKGDNSEAFALCDRCDAAKQSGQPETEV